MLKGYDDILVLSGAGFGIDAGLPDYDGVHAIVDEAAARFGVEPYMIEHPGFYKENPRAAWGMKARVMNIFLTKEPHEGYDILRDIATKKNVFVVTSNIDDHFRIAGFNESKLYEIHGRLKVLQCVNRSCNLRHNLWEIDHLPQEEDMNLVGSIPMCKYCGDYARPNVCFTDDNSFCNKLRDAQKARFNEWIKRVSRKRNPRLLVIEIGCGRHRDSIGVSRLHDGHFRILSKELEIPKNFTEENLDIIRVNPDRGIPVEKWEKVYYQTGLDFFKKNILL